MLRVHLLLVLTLFSLVGFAEESARDIEYFYFLDKSGRSDIESISRQDQHLWQSAPEDIVSYGVLDPNYLAGTYGANLWLKVLLPEKTKLDRIWLELLPNVGLDGMLATQHNGGWIWHSPVGRTGTKFEDMPARFLTFIVDTSIVRDSTDNRVAYIKLSSDQIFHFQIRAKTLDELPEYFIEQSLFVGFIFGILILAIAYNGTIGITAREPSFIYYALYEICVTFYLASVAGYMHVFVDYWPSGATPNNFGVIMCVLTALLFVRSLLDTKTMQPRLDKILCVSIYGLSLSAVIVVIVPPYISYPLTETVGLIGPVIVLIVGYRAYKLRHPLALYFLASWITFLCVASTWAWMWLGFFDPSENMLKAIFAGTAIEALLLSLILGFRFGHLKRTTENQVVEITNYQTLSETDELTGINNRRGLLCQVEELVDKQIPFVWGAIDVDHFKKFNDAYGHLAGDKLLKKLGALIDSKNDQKDSISNRKNESGIAYPSQIAGRVGGEEFAIILPGRDLKQAEKRLNQLKRAFTITTVALSSGESVGTTLSIGATEYVPGEDLETTWRRADQLLYEAKNAGRNTSVLRNIAV